MQASSSGGSSAAACLAVMSVATSHTQYWASVLGPCPQKATQKLQLCACSWAKWGSAQAEATLLKDAGCYLQAHNGTAIHSLQAHPTLIGQVPTLRPCS